MVIELSGVQFGLKSYEWFTKSHDRESVIMITIIITISEKQKKCNLKIGNSNNKLSSVCWKTAEIIENTLGKISSVETLSKVTNSSILENTPALKVKLLSCCSDRSLCCDWWI